MQKQIAAAACGVVLVAVAWTACPAGPTPLYGILVPSLLDSLLFSAQRG